VKVVFITPYLPKKGYPLGKIFFRTKPHKQKEEVWKLPEAEDRRIWEKREKRDVWKEEGNFRRPNRLNQKRSTHKATEENSIGSM